MMRMMVFVCPCVLTDIHTYIHTYRTFIAKSSILALPILLMDAPSISDPSFRGWHMLTSLEMMMIIEETGSGEHN